MIAVAFLAFIIASAKPASIFTLVHYAWGGLGASFGPLLLYSIYGKKCTKFGAYTGMISGGIMAAIWPYFNRSIPFMIDPLLPAFTLSFILNWSFSQVTYKVKNYASQA